MKLIVRCIHLMDEIEIESSSSENSSCSEISYEGTDGYISDGEDPFFIHPPDQQEDFEQEIEESLSSDDEDEDDSTSQKSKTSADYEQKKMRREKKIQVKEIMDEIKYGRNTTMLLNKNPVVPTYEQISKITNEIKKMFPHRSFDKIITNLYNELIWKPKNKQIEKILKERNPPKPTTREQIEKRNKYLRQTYIAAESFCELGYGITKMRKFIEQNAINIDIDIHTYEGIIKKLLLNAYSRLERFLRGKCHKKIKSHKVDSIQEKFLLEALKNCTKTLDPFEIHNFYKFIKLTYEQEQKENKKKISKRIASRLYHTCQQFIMRKKIKSGFMDPDNPDCQIYNNDKYKWSEEMIETAIDIYIKEGSLNRTKEIMWKKFNIDQVLLHNRNIKYHIENKVRIALDIITNAINNSKNDPLVANKIKKLEPLDEVKIQWIMTSIHATNVRVVLCEIYKAKEPTHLHLNQAILAINQFIIKRSNEEMLMEKRKIEKESNPNCGISRRRGHRS